jgi:hypothetical protein
MLRKIDNKRGIDLWTERALVSRFLGAPAVWEERGKVAIVLVSQDGVIWGFDSQKGYAFYWENRDAARKATLSSTPVIIDINSDGLDDIVVAFEEIGVVIIDGKALSDRWNELFTPATNTELDMGVLRAPIEGLMPFIAAKDLDSNSLPDVVVCTERQLLTYEWDAGKQKLSPKKSFPTKAAITAPPCLGDVDGDGNVEIVEACSVGAYLFDTFRNEGKEITNETPKGDIVLSDLNHNGVPDVIVTSQGELKAFDLTKEGEPKLILQEQIVQRDDQATSLVIGDVGGDRTLDVVLGARSGRGLLYSLNTKYSLLSWFPFFSPKTWTMERGNLQRTGSFQKGCYERLADRSEHIPFRKLFLSFSVQMQFILIAVIGVITVFIGNLFSLAVEKSLRFYWF